MHRLSKRRALDRDRCKRLNDKERSPLLFVPFVRIAAETLSRFSTKINNYFTARMSARFLHVLEHVACTCRKVREKKEKNVAE